MESTHYNLCFAWQGDYDSLKTFFSNELKLDDVWAQSGGDKMVFSTTDVSISWRKSKNLLYIVGDEMGKYMELFCSKIYKAICPKVTTTDESSQTEAAIMQSSVRKSNEDICS